MCYDVTCDVHTMRDWVVKTGEYVCVLPAKNVNLCFKNYMVPRNAHSPNHFLSCFIAVATLFSSYSFILKGPTTGHNVTLDPDWMKGPWIIMNRFKHPFCCLSKTSIFKLCVNVTASLLLRSLAEEPWGWIMESFTLLYAVWCFYAHHN